MKTECARDRTAGKRSAESEGKKKKETDSAQDAIYQSLEEKIKGIVGTKVSIRRGSKQKGKIEIEYYSQDELERLVELFESINE